MHRCCAASGISRENETAATTSDHQGLAEAGRRSWTRRFVAFSKWVVPLCTLAILPKCPVCVASYVLLLTGVSISLPVATAIRLALASISIAFLFYLLIRLRLRFASVAVVKWNSGPAPDRQATQH